MSLTKGELELIASYIDNVLRTSIERHFGASASGPLSFEKVVAGAIDEITSSLEEIWARLVALEERPVAQLPYRGTYDDDTKYAMGDMVTKAGSVWVALRDNPGRPGDGNKAWQLAVKAGRDARRTKEPAYRTKIMTPEDE